MYIAVCIFLVVGSIVSATLLDNGAIGFKERPNSSKDKTKTKTDSETKTPH